MSSKNWFKFLLFDFCFWQIFILLVCESVFGYVYVTKTFSVPVDHFSFSRNETFEMRYLINDSYWKQEKGPIFFYTGNEGDIETFAENTGFMWEIAPAFKALVVFAEHRYYGKSLPFKNQSYTDNKYLGYLTSQQALADYVDLILHLSWNETRGYRNPVIAFGGSYGGMLAAYIRMKYPYVVNGAIASSAPIWQFTGMVPCDAFARIVTSVFTFSNKSCSTIIRNSWAVISNITSKGEGLQWLSTEWKLCRPLKNETDVQILKDWLAESYGYLAMLNYPYPTKFLLELPGHPIHKVCKQLHNSSVTGQDLLKALYRGISVYFNNTGTQKCLNFDSSSTSSLGLDGWDYQSCTEMVMPMCSKGNNDMFEPQAWNITKFSEKCKKKWNVIPQPYLAQKNYGGKQIDEFASNIIFSNGLLDPWTSGGVLKTNSPNIKVVLIPEAAHHLDLRGSNPSDPDSVRKYRLFYQEMIKTWIKEHETKHSI